MYVEMSGVHMLFDVGSSMKKINNHLLIEAGVNLEDIDIVFITHAHSDHIHSLFPILNRYPDIKFAMVKEVRNEVVEAKKKNIPADRRIDLVDGRRLEGKYINIDNIKLNHDVTTYAYKITDKITGLSYGHAADNGGLRANKYIEFFKGLDYYAIESNHDLTMQVMDVARHEGLRRRVLNYYGHSHNVDAIEFAFRVITQNTKGIIFHHLSKDCNSPELAKSTHDEMIKIFGQVTNFRNIAREYALQGEAVVLYRDEV